MDSRFFFGGGGFLNLEFSKIFKHEDIEEERCERHQLNLVLDLNEILQGFRVTLC